MICINCKHFFTFGSRPDGTPNGVGFELEDGRTIDICADCLVRLGQMNDEQKKEFFDKLDWDN